MAETQEQIKIRLLQQSKNSLEEELGEAGSALFEAEEACEKLATKYNRLKSGVRVTVTAIALVGCTILGFDYLTKVEPSPYHFGIKNCQLDGITSYRPPANDESFVQVDCKEDYKEGNARRSYCLHQYPTPGAALLAEECDKTEWSTKEVFTVSR